MNIETITYTIKKSGNARRVKLAVHSDGRVVVTLPRGVGKRVAMDFVKAKRAWISKKLLVQKKRGQAGGAKLGRKEYLEHKESARALVHARVEHFNTIYKHSFKNIAIRNQKTRWGSCSRKGSLNFNFRLLFLPEALRDYVIVHELCHLKEMNHSPAFWKLVATQFPNFKKMRKELHKRKL